MCEPVTTTRLSIAYWCERVTYRSMDAGGIADVARYSVARPADAVRSVRVDVRALAAELSPTERHRALSWVEGAGCVGAVAALHRGEPCGFSLSHRDRWIEWTVRPFSTFEASREALLPLLPTTGCAGESMSASAPPAAAHASGRVRARTTTSATG
ncbi:hypothetical protein [Streptomyces sp. NPDC051569]|uniref:hypothetical protein n=1 Tax=Streptomyces sp. NPDC051569 TaxID=3365661 RepID=UPI0037AED196